MKKIRRRLATILAMVMVITSFTFLGVYADPTDPPADPTDVTLTGGEGGEGGEDMPPIETPTHSPEVPGGEGEGGGGVVPPVESPPPSQGGSCASNSSLPQRAPVPVGA